MTILSSAFGSGSSKKSAASPQEAAQVQEQEVMRAQEITSPHSPVTQMFNGRSVFITGASGFIGRVLLEKLLRCYPQIKNIYILMRQKKNQNPYDRLHKQLLSVPIFDQIRSMKNGQELLDKIVVIPGDIGDSWLGISDSDLKRLFADQNLGIVFHSAATIKFDEPLKVSVRLNLVATRTVIDFCRKLPNLISFCHVSTCYTNSDILDQQTMIEERVYPMSDQPKDLMQLADILEEDLMQTLKHSMVKQRPNTYTYTKALAEKYIQTEAADLPIAIVRPSIVVASWKDPMPGWVDNINGPTGLVLAIGKGLLRSLYCNVRAKADIIPVDIVVNAMVASSYYAARAYGTFHPLPATVADQQTVNLNNNNTDTDNISEKSATGGRESEADEKAALSLAKPPIFQVNSGDLNPLTWAEMEDFSMPIIRKYPSCQVLRYPYGTFKTNQWHDLITRIFVHYLPALFLDAVCMLMGKKRQLLSIYYKLHCAIAALAHFMTFSYNFETKNLAKLRALLASDERDSQTLFMDIENLNWRDFWDSYVLGCRRYILREQDDSLEQARKSFARSRHIELAYRSVLVVLALSCLWLALGGSIQSSLSGAWPTPAQVDLEHPELAASNGTCHNQSAASSPAHLISSSLDMYCNAAAATAAVSAK